jgi:hypothetical protein
MPNELEAAALALVWVFMIVWIWTRKPAWWEVSRPVSRLTYLNIIIRGPLAYVPVVTLGLVVLGISSRIAVTMPARGDWVQWLGIGLDVGLLVAIFGFNQPRFLLPPGYKRVFLKGVKPFSRRGR